MGEYYKPHHDSSGAKDSSVSGHRIMTFFLYLNDVPEGGETRFTNLDISVHPKKGTIGCMVINNCHQSYESFH